MAYSSQITNNKRNSINEKTFCHFCHLPRLYLYLRVHTDGLLLNYRILLVLCRVAAVLDYIHLLIMVHFRFSRTETLLNYINTGLSSIGASSGIAYEEIFKKTAVKNMRLTIVNESISDYYLMRVSKKCFIR